MRKKKILEACKGWNIRAGADVFSYFLSAVGMSLTNNAHPTGQWWERRGRNWGQRSGSVSHHERSSLTGKGAASFRRDGGDPHRKDFARMLGRPHLRVSGTHAWSSQHPHPLVYPLLKAKTSGFPFLDCSNWEWKPFNMKNVTDLVTR